MKKLICLIAFGLIWTGVGFAVDVEVSTTSQVLINSADQAIANWKISIDKLLAALQTIHKWQKETVKQAVEAGNKIELQKTLTQWSDMYGLTSHLYNMKAGSGATLTNNSGQNYSFRKWSELDFLNIYWGDEQYYRFPMKDKWVEVDFGFGQSGMLVQETNFKEWNDSYYPTYFYDGDKILTELTRKDPNMAIIELWDKTDNRYFFFDVKGGETWKASLNVGNNQNVNLNQIYFAESYNPEYYLISLNEGFEYCKKVAERVGENNKQKEYGAEECTNASKWKFSKEMHPDILNFAIENLTNK